MASPASGPPCSTFGAMSTRTTASSTSGERRGGEKGPAPADELERLLAEGDEGRAAPFDGALWRRRPIALTRRAARSATRFASRSLERATAKPATITAKTARPTSAAISNLSLRAPPRQGPPRRRSGGRRSPRCPAVRANTAAMMATETRVPTIGARPVRRFRRTSASSTRTSSSSGEEDDSFTWRPAPALASGVSSRAAAWFPRSRRPRA
jgi:hypothetical protein